MQIIIDRVVEILLTGVALPSRDMAEMIGSAPGSIENAIRKHRRGEGEGDLTTKIYLVGRVPARRGQIANVYSLDASAALAGRFGDADDQQHLRKKLMVVESTIKRYRSAYASVRGNPFATILIHCNAHRQTVHA